MSEENNSNVHDLPHAKSDSEIVQEYLTERCNASFETGYVLGKEHGGKHALLMVAIIMVSLTTFILCLITIWPVIRSFYPIIKSLI